MGGSSAAIEYPFKKKVPRGSHAPEPYVGAYHSRRTAAGQRILLRRLIAYRAQQGMCGGGSVSRSHWLAAAARTAGTPSLIESESEKSS
eukprot:COSAG01_NODE_67319_length_267_cov_0.922619_1_plen_88_part_11